MKANINGIEVEGTKEEVAELIKLFGKEQQPPLKEFIPVPVNPYTLPVQPYIGTPQPLRTVPQTAPWTVTCKDNSNTFMWN